MTVSRSQPGNRDLRRPPFDALQIILGILGVAALGGFTITLALGIIYAVGETLEHFTP